MIFFLAFHIHCGVILRAFSHKIDYVTIFKEILNPGGHSNCITGSKVTAILLNEWILPIGGASLVRVCACSLRSMLVFSINKLTMFVLLTPTIYCFHRQAVGSLLVNFKLVNTEIVSN